MGVACVELYRVPLGKRDEFLNAVRATFALAEDRGARTALWNTLVGGELSGVHAAVFSFADPVARGKYLDASTTPEHRADPLQLLQTDGITLLGRSFLNELPGATDPPTQAQVLAAIRIQVAPGRDAEADSALRQAVELRRSVGIEAHVYTAQYAGAATGLRFLVIHASSHQQLAEDAANVVAHRQEWGGVGPIPYAVASGVMTMTGSTISTLVAL